MANSAIHPSGVGKCVVIHVVRYMDYGVKAPLCTVKRHYVKYRAFL